MLGCGKQVLTSPMVRLWRSCHQTDAELQPEDCQWGECSAGLVALAGVLAGTCTLGVGQGFRCFMPGCSLGPPPLLTPDPRTATASTSAVVPSSVSPGWSLLPTAMLCECFPSTCTPPSPHLPTPLPWRPLSCHSALLVAAQPRSHCSPGCHFVILGEYDLSSSTEPCRFCPSCGSVPGLQMGKEEWAV